MDYCSSCRRHLNGALACPGCGAYAPDIAPVALATTGTAPAWVAPPSDTWADDPGDDLTPVPSAPDGRAARRRQRARWKKNQRRAVVATAVALVGGGLTVSAMNQRPGDRAQAATAPQSSGTDSGMTTDAGAAELPATSYTRPTGTQPDTRLSSTPSAPAAPERPRGRHAAPPVDAPSDVRPDAAAPPRAATTPVPQSQAVSPTPEATVPDSSTPAPAQTPAATPTATDPSPETPAPSPTPAATSPTQLCLLVICLG